MVEAMITTTCDVCGAAAECKIYLSHPEMESDFDLCRTCHKVEIDRMWKSFNEHHKAKDE